MQNTDAMRSAVAVLSAAPVAALPSIASVATRTDPIFAALDEFKGLDAVRISTIENTDAAQALGD